MVCEVLRIRWYQVGGLNIFMCMHYDDGGKKLDGELLEVQKREGKDKGANYDLSLKETNERTKYD